MVYRLKGTKTNVHTASTNTNLLCSAVKFLETIFQSRHACLELRMLKRQQILVEFDLFQEALWSCVVVAPVILQVQGTDVIDRHMNVGHELGHS